jgi:hypothetical protein
VSQYFEVHPDNPQLRLLKQAAQILEDGGVCAVPTDSSYALVCHLDDKAAADALRRIRGVDDKHHLTLLCRDLSELASYARVDNKQYRLLKHGTPGPFTFILDATKEVPRRLSHPSRRTIGLRAPDHHADRAGRNRADERPARDPRALSEGAAGGGGRRRLPAPAHHGGRPHRGRAGGGAPGAWRPGAARPVDGRGLARYGNAAVMTISTFH